MEMHVELQTACSALGVLEGNRYHKEPDCLETVKDLIRFLKREDEDTCDIRRQLGEAQILQKDLLYILKQYPEDTVLFETVIRLMVNLTQPAFLCWQHIPEDKERRQCYIEVEGYLQNYKQDFADEALFACLTKKLGDLLQLDWERRQEEDRMLIERLLILLRNILHVPPNLAKEQRTDDDASVHDQVLWAIHVSGMEDLLLYLASSENERQFAFHVLEIISLMFREQNPEQLAKAGAFRTQAERKAEEDELAKIREMEKMSKKAAILKQSARHSRFGGTYVLSNMKSISDRNVIYHKGIEKVNDMTFDQGKRPKKIGKNRQPIKDAPLVRRSTLSIRLFLKEFCIQFLENCYNPLMHAVKDTLLRAKAQDNDETYYLWAMRFFMEFQRRHQFRIDTVGETLSVPAFHYIQTNMITYFEMITQDKKQALSWSRRTHLGLKAYRELLETLYMMGKSEEFKDSAKVIQANVFYMIEYRELLLTLLKNFKESKQSRQYLQDLIETTHLFLRMLEHHCKGNRHIMVQKKKKGGRKKTKKRANQENQPPQQTEEELEELWDAVSGDLSAVFQGRENIPEGIAPFDAASQVEVDEQRIEAMIRIQDAMRQHRAGEAVAILRAAREVWPEREEFGRVDIEPEQEFMALREVFFANLPRPQPEAAAAEEEEVSDDEEEQEVQATYDSEQEFDLREYIMKFCQPQVVKAYVLLLADYTKNSPQVNHAIIKMLHRIGFEYKMIGMLFQARLFRIFQRILADPLAKTKHYAELATFAKYVVRNFFEVAEKNPTVFLELFFWKSVRDSLEIVEGYGTYKAQAKGGKVAWTEEQDNELRQLFEQYQNDENKPEGDAADYIMLYLLDQTKTRRQIVREMVHLGLIGSAKELKKSSGKSHKWREEEEAELRALYEQFKESQDPMGNILENMTNQRSKPITIKKMLEMGLVQDRSELYKKRGKSGRRRARGTDDESDSDDDAPKRGRKQKKKKKPANPWIIKEGEENLPTWSSSEDEAKENKEPSGVRDNNPGVSRALSSESESEADVPIGDSSFDSDEDNDSPAFVINIRKAAKAARDKGFEPGMQWLSNCMSQVADDREEDEDEEPIPLVPLTEEQENAMEDKTFRNLLKTCGINPPADEQERFWRVPGHLTPADLRARVDAMKPQENKPREKKPKVTQPQEKKPQEKKKSTSTDDKFEALLAKVRQKAEGGAKRKRRTRPKSDDESELGGSSQASTSQQASPVMDKKKRKPKRIAKVDDSSDDNSDEDRLLIDVQSPSAAVSSDSDEDEPLQSSKVKNGNERVSDTDTPSSSKKTLKKVRVAAIASDSDSGSEGQKRPSKKAKVAMETDDEEETEQMEEDGGGAQMEPGSFPATMFTQDLSSDSDIEDHIPLIQAKRPVIQSDSEED